MKRWFLSDPRYNNLTDVWLWEEFPARKNLGGADLGIDLVARDDMGDYWAIQCKCYHEYALISKGDVDSFLANASRHFLDESGNTREFSHLIWVQTSRKGWGDNAEEAIRNLNKPFNRICLKDLEESSVDWDKLLEGLEGKDARQEKKQPREHQIEAVKKAKAHFAEHDRGKLIMACGTGKTYTSLKIMEELTGQTTGQAPLVLFFVPSIALLSQSLNAWMSDSEGDIKAICVCSDSKASRRMADKSNEDDKDMGIVDLAVPTTTDTRSILNQITKYRQQGSRTVIFSTYQSIDAVSAAMHEAGLEAALCICDEAHRTTGVKFKGGARNITKEMIFYYVYGYLHSEAYKSRFASDLKKSLPRISIVERIEDFLQISQVGRALAQLHLHYETLPPCESVTVIGDRTLTGTEDDYSFYSIPDKMRFAKTRNENGKTLDDRTKILYNANITIENIPPEAYDYIVNGKSAIECLVERYALTKDTKSLIVNDCNAWAKEHGKPRYILDLLLSVISLSLQTVALTRTLPTLSF